MEEKFLSKNFTIEKAYNLDVYEQHGGYAPMRKAFGLDTDEIIAQMKASNLRGRGGAGFPTGVKWGFMPRDSDVVKYLVINADEGEPGTFKDRSIMELDPHRLVEGCIITAWTLGLRRGYIFVRGELQHAMRRLEAAIKQAYEKGYLGSNIQGKGFDFDLHVHSSAGAYICGEETGLIEGLEGKPGQPRMKPPFPAIVGAFGKPTLVNNVETIAAVPFIVERGGEFWASLGIEKNGGPKLYGLSGFIKRPGVYEAPSGITVGELLERFGGGMLEGHELKAFIPGGSSCAVLKPDALDAQMGFETMREAGSSLGTGCVTFIDTNTCMVRLAARLGPLLPPRVPAASARRVREGTGWAYKVINAIEFGHGQARGPGAARLTSATTSRATQSVPTATRWRSRSEATSRSSPRSSTSISPLAAARSALHPGGGGATR